MPDKIEELDCESCDGWGEYCPGKGHPGAFQPECAEQKEIELAIYTKHHPKAGQVCRDRDMIARRDKGIVIHREKTAEEMIEWIYRLASIALGGGDADSSDEAFWNRAVINVKMALAGEEAADESR